MESNLKVTCITALYDINRERKDGRTITDYLKWLEKTIQLNVNVVIYVQNELYEDVKKICDMYSNSNPDRIIIKPTRLEEVPYYKYINQIEDILNNSEYKSKIKDPNRIECHLPLYNIIQYSKCEWIRNVIYEYNKDLNNIYFWIDAGCSRFFNNSDISKPFPNIKSITEQINIQGRYDLNSYNFNSYEYDSANLVCGTLFGGSSKSMLWLADNLHSKFIELLNKGIVNNEQIAIALLWKQFPEKFNIFMNRTNSHLPFFQYLLN